MGMKQGKCASAFITVYFKSGGWRKANIFVAAQGIHICSPTQVNDVSFDKRVHYKEISILCQRENCLLGEAAEESAKRLFFGIADLMGNSK
jgi:hypothetical protein